MSKILFAWELGGNYGHITKTLPVAEALRESGHQVIYAARDLIVAEELLTTRNISFFAVPLPVRATSLSRPPGNYAELLLAEGYGNATLLAGQVRAWLSLLNLIRPNVVVIDHAPTAAIAATIMGVLLVSIGNSFELPPHPLPAIRPFDRSLDAELRSSEAKVIENINRVLRMHNTEPLTRLSDLFPVHTRLLTTFPEFDHFGPRDGATYIGPIGTISSGDAIDWPMGPAPRIFAYLRPHTPGTAGMLNVLSELSATIVCTASGLPMSQAKQMSKPNFTVSSKAIQVEQLLPTADLVISHGGGLTVSALAQGIPVLVIPHTVEQLLLGLRVRALGVGIAIEQDRRPQTLLNSLNQLVQEPSYRIAARALADKYRDTDPQLSVHTAVTCIEHVINGHLYHEHKQID